MADKIGFVCTRALTGHLAYWCTTEGLWTLDSSKASKHTHAQFMWLRANHEHFDGLVTHWEPVALYSASQPLAEPAESKAKLGAAHSIALDTLAREVDIYKHIVSQKREALGSNRWQPVCLGTIRNYLATMDESIKDLRAMCMAGEVTRKSHGQMLYAQIGGLSEALAQLIAISDSLADE